MSTGTPTRKFGTEYPGGHGDEKKSYDFVAGTGKVVSVYRPVALLASSIRYDAGLIRRVGHRDQRVCNSALNPRDLVILGVCSDDILIVFIWHSKAKLRHISIPG